jgi:hypothetical protein
MLHVHEVRSIEARPRAFLRTPSARSKLLCERGDAEDGHQPALHLSPSSPLPRSA